MKRILALILTAAMLVSMFAVITTAANSYEFTINGIDVPVESGGVVVCTSLESWANCNPNWSNNLQLTPNGDSYKVIAASSCPGESLSSVTADALIEASGFTANDGDIYVILHGEGNANAYSVGVGMTVTIDNLEAGGIITFSDTVSSDDNTGDDNTDGDNTDDTGATEDEVAPDEPVEPETPTDTKAIEVENNVAAGKSYTTSLPFRMGSADINWAYDETAEITFPDTDGIELTDGLLAADCDYRNSAWVGLHDNTPDAVAAGYSWVTVDLAGEYNVTEIRVYMPSSAPAFAQYGIAPSYVTFVGYDNNGIAVELGDGSLMDSDSETFAYSSMVCDIALTKVEVRMIRGCGWTFVSEIVIVGTETTSDDNVGDDNTGGDDMDAPTEGNLALGKDYVSDAPIVNPENSVDYSANLTDGVVATEFGFDGSWFMFNNGVNTTDSKGIVVVELVDLVDITQLKVHLCEKLDFGVAAPSEITAWGSKDGCNYTKMGSLSIPADRTDGIGCWATLDVTDAWYRFVKFNIELNGNYALVNEVEVYGTYHECSPCLADEWDSDVENHWHECECGEKIDIAAHIEGEWVTVLEPEIGKEGKEELCCTVCDYLISEGAIPALEDEVAPDEPVVPELIGLRGDLNNNGEIDARDYGFLKQAYFGTYTPNETGKMLADVNENSIIDPMDYLFVKRAYFGTYRFSEENVYVKAESSDSDAVGGEDGGHIDFEVIVSAQDEYVAGNDVTVTVTVENISANTSLQYVSALLYFDNTKLSPPDFSSGIHINVFSGFAEWEDLSVPVSDNCIRLTALTAGGNYGDTFTDATDDFDLMFEITFTALDSAKGNLDFQIPQAGISGCRVEVEDPYTKIEYIGKGSSAVIKERKITYDVPEDSEIKIEIDGDDSFESGTVVTVTELPSDDIPDSISVSLNDVSNKYVAFDFTATKDGESVQPSEPISVTLSIPADFTTNVSVYYISDNGERELIDAVIDAENRTITVVLEHFSNYVLVDNASMIGLRGDVTKNGEIDSRDYVFLKRAYFGTYKLDETATLLADVNNSGGLDSRDYVFLKRAYFGTYKIPDAVKYVYAE